MYKAPTSIFLKRYKLAEMHSGETFAFQYEVSASFENVNSLPPATDNIQVEINQTNTTFNLRKDL